MRGETEYTQLSGCKVRTIQSCLDSPYMVMKNMVSMSYIVTHLGQAELDCTVTLQERGKTNAERIYLIV